MKKEITGDIISSKRSTLPGSMRTRWQLLRR